MEVRHCYVRLEILKSNYHRIGQIRPDYDRLGQVRPGNAMLDQFLGRLFRLGQVFPC